MQTRFDRARDNAGNPVAGVYTGWYQKREGQWLRTELPDWSPPDLSFSVNKMPAGIPDFP
jgi:hypothetical protein